MCVVQKKLKFSIDVRYAHMGGVIKIFKGDILNASNKFHCPFFGKGLRFSLVKMVKSHYCFLLQIWKKKYSLNCNLNYI